MYLLILFNSPLRLLAGLFLDNILCGDTDRQISSGTLYTLFDRTFKLHLRVLSLPLNEDYLGSDTDMTHGPQTAAQNFGETLWDQSLWMMCHACNTLASFSTYCLM